MVYFSSGHKVSLRRTICQVPLGSDSMERSLKMYEVAVYINKNTGSKIRLKKQQHCKHAFKTKAISSCSETCGLFSSVRM